MDDEDLGMPWPITSMDATTEEAMIQVARSIIVGPWFDPADQLFGDPPSSARWRWADDEAARRPSSSTAPTP